MTKIIILRQYTDENCECKTLAVFSTMDLSDEGLKALMGEYIKVGDIDKLNELGFVQSIHVLNELPKREIKDDPTNGITKNSCRKCIHKHNISTQMCVKIWCLCTEGLGKIKLEDGEGTMLPTIQEELPRIAENSKICEKCKFSHDSYDGCCDDCSPSAGSTLFCTLGTWRKTKLTNTCAGFIELPVLHESEEITNE